MSSSSTLVDVLLAELDDDHQGSNSMSAAMRTSLERHLTDVVVAAEERWTPIAIERPTFIAYVASRLRIEDGDFASAIDRMHTTSLYLACACFEGDSAAISLFESTYLQSIGPALSRLDRTGTVADDAKQELRERLFLAKPEGRAKIADYGGRGELKSWVRAVAVRIGLDLLRVHKREALRKEDDDILAALPDGDDPELEYLREHYGDALRRSFATVLSDMPAKQRGVLRCHFVDRVNIEEIGRIYQVHKTTAFRWLEKARATLIDLTREHLKKQLGIDTAELDSVMRLIDSDVQLSLPRLLEPSESAGP